MSCYLIVWNKSVFKSFNFKIIWLKKWVFALKLCLFQFNFIHLDNVACMLKLYFSAVFPVKIVSIATCVLKLWNIFWYLYIIFTSLGHNLVQNCWDTVPLWTYFPRPFSMLLMKSRFDQTCHILIATLLPVGEGGVFNS